MPGARPRRTSTRTSCPDPVRLLSARGLVGRSGELTVAAVLLFARAPQRWFPEASVRVLRYRGTVRGTGARQRLIHDRRIEGPISVQLATARAEILDQLPTRRALGRGGQFERSDSSMRTPGSRLS